MSELRHFLDLHQVGAENLRSIIDDAAAVKRGRVKGADASLAGRTLAMIFEKPSTRTRVSFEVGMRQLGGDVVMLSGKELQLGRGETIADTARVLSRYVDAIVIRTFGNERLMQLAEAASVPVINGLTDETHPAQLMADVLTFEEHRGPVKGRVFAWCGDGNNVARSWIRAAACFDFELRMACPEELQPDAELVSWANRNGGRIIVGPDLDSMVTDVDCVVTDTWVSMGDKEAANRHNLLRPYQVSERVMRLAGPEALFMHCLPAHRGEEVVDAVIDGPQSVVWDEAENRLHAQKGILRWCLQ